MNYFQICLKRPKLKLGALPIKRLKTDSNIIPYHDNLVIQNNCIRHDHTYFKLVNDTSVLQSFEFQYPEVGT